MPPGSVQSSRPTRDKLLSNPAVEFMENRASPELTMVPDKSGQSASIQYDPLRDKWVPEEDLVREKFYQASEDQRHKLEVALHKFSQSIKTYQAANQKKAPIIPIKPLGEYQFDDVLKVIQKIEERHKFKEYPKGLQTLGNVFERTMKDRGTLKALLDFVPRDSYCAPICGSFSFILAALDRAGDFREKAVEVLSNIPTQLEEKFTRSLFQSYASIQTTAMKEFTASIDRFQQQVSHDSHLRIGDGYSRIGEMGQSLQQMREENNKSTEFAQRMDARNQEAFDRITTELREQREDKATICNYLYGLLTSAPWFKERLLQFDAGIIPPPRETRALAPGGQSTLTSQRNKTTRAFIRSWIKEVKLHPSTAAKDRKSLLNSFDDLGIDDKDILWWILGTTELKDWLNTEGSQNLFIQAETPPDKLVNPLCFAAAFLVDQIQSMVDSNVHILTYLTAVRRDKSSSITSATLPLRIINHLNTQLLSSICERRIPMDLSTVIQKKKVRGQTQHQMSAALELIRAVLIEMPANSMVFIVLDSGSAHDGLDDDGDEVPFFKALLKLGDETDVVVKVLLTDTLAGLASALKKSSFEVLYVPDHVDGDQQDLAFQTLTEDVKDPSMATFLSSPRADRGNDENDSDSDTEISELIEYALSSTSEAE
ncbi:hypothetical protein LTR84_005593 [Exophiala bonariae]|uniref:Uncharacterized protein n=1 Tax=Exophiala bonariae TaxID=1690606 RepID=A0AAV9N6V5_9EURO|nr:hypothetical protein LTR84_005593 [Exophiala bonariae]